MEAGVSWGDDLRACAECGAVARAVCLQCSVLRADPAMACYCTPCSAVVHKLTVTAQHAPMTLKDAKDIYVNVKNLELPSPVMDVCAELSGDNDANGLVTEYKKFLIVKLLFGDYRLPTQLVPLTQDVEDVWKTHAGDASYSATCRAVAQGNELPCDPAALESVSQEKFAWQRAVTKQCYAMLFASSVSTVPRTPSGLRLKKGTTATSSTSSLKGGNRPGSDNTLKKKTSFAASVSTAFERIERQSSLDLEEEGLGRRVTSTHTTPTSTRAADATKAGRSALKKGSGGGGAKPLPRDAVPLRRTPSGRNEAAWALANCAPTEPSPESPIPSDGEIEAYERVAQEATARSEVTLGRKDGSFYGFFDTSRKIGSGRSRSDGDDKESPFRRIRSFKNTKRAGAGVDVSSEPDDERVLIFFLCKAGNVSCNCDLSGTVYAVKEQLHLEGSLPPPEEQKWFYQGKVLEDDRVLATCNVHRNSYINVIERGAGAAS